VDRVPFAVEAVRSALDQSYSAKEVIVVVDRVHGLWTALQGAMPPGVVMMENNEGYGLSNARNTGVLATAAEFVAFLDDDAVADHDWLARILARFDDPLVAAAGGKAIPFWLGSGQRPSWLAEEFDWVVGCTYKGFAQDRTFVRNIHGSNMCFRRSVFELVGLFEPLVGGPVAGDDTELCLRIIARPEGFRIAYEPTAVVYHKVPVERQTIRYLLSNSFDEGRGKAIIRMLHRGQRSALSSEKGYLSLLLRGFFPGRFRSLLLRGDSRSGRQLAAGILSVAAVAVGHATSRIVYPFIRYRVIRHRAQTRNVRGPAGGMYRAATGGGGGVNGTRPAVTALICALNEEASIPWVLNRIPADVNEIILVDGHSSDRTVEVAKQVRPGIKVYFQPGKGKGDALRFGFSKATGDIIVTVDADGQNDPQELWKLVEPIIHEGYDLVKGSRFQLGLPKGMVWYRMFGNWFLTMAANVLYGVKFTDVCSGFNAFPRAALERIRYQELGRHDYELVVYFRALRAGLRIKEVGNFDRGRVAGESKMPTWHTGWNNFKIIVRERFRRPPEPIYASRRIEPQSREFKE